MLEEVYYRLKEKYPLETIEFVYKNLFGCIKTAFTKHEAYCVYLNKLGYFFLHLGKIESKIKAYVVRELDYTKLEELRTRALKYPPNKRWEERNKYNLQRRKLIKTKYNELNNERSTRQVDESTSVCE
jgi:hypothetical protein